MLRPENGRHVLRIACRMSFRIHVLPPSPALAGDVMGYVVRRRTREGTPPQEPFSAHFPANMYAALTIVHRGRLVDPAGVATAPVSFSGAMTRDVQRDYHGLPETPTLLRLAKALRCSVEALLDGVDADYEQMRKTTAPSDVN